MFRTACLAMALGAVLLLGVPATMAAPPGPAALERSIETARRTIADHERTLAEYNAEMRTTTANDPAAVKRRREIQIIKQYYVHEIERLKANIIADYKKIQEFKAAGVY